LGGHQFGLNGHSIDQKITAERLSDRQIDLSCRSIDQNG
jgi:hypothetical protein